MSNIQGWINLYKPPNISSFKAINKIKKKFDIDKIGHGGTLDPNAEGVLPIAIGKTTKLIPYINNSLKNYKFIISWGQLTSTDDSDGDILQISNRIPNIKEITKVINKFVGNILQSPPKVSAVKINGVRAYKLARKNIDFETTKRNVFVKNIEVVKNYEKKTEFSIECGKGFYIRSFARDISKDLGTYGHISFLNRTKVGKFNIESSILLDDLLKIGERLTDINCVQKSISMLDDILALEVEDRNDLKEISLGKSISINDDKINNISSNNLDNNVFLSNNGDVVSIGKLIGNLFKPKKVLI